MAGAMAFIGLSIVKLKVGLRSGSSVERGMGVPAGNKMADPGQAAMG